MTVEAAARSSQRLAGERPRLPASLGQAEGRRRDLPRQRLLFRVPGTHDEFESEPSIVDDVSPCKPPLKAPCVSAIEGSVVWPFGVRKVNQDKHGLLRGLFTVPGRCSTAVFTGLTCDRLV